MTTAIMIFGGLAAIGWLSDKLTPAQEWRETQRRMTAPVMAPRPVAKPVQLDVRPRIINPLEKTYDECATLS